MAERFIICRLMRAHVYTEEPRFEQLAISLFVALNVALIQYLRRTRDLLLPRLLSGQVGLETETA